MFCILALVIFSILGIFSAAHRRLAKEAFDCVFRRITLRPCNTGFDQKIKGKIIGKLLNRSPRLAKSIHRYWELISWVLVGLFFVSLFFSARTVYNLARYKTCDPAEPQNCILSSEECSPSDHCKPCECGTDELECQTPDYTACDGEENCDCDTSCEVNQSKGGEKL